MDKNVCNAENDLKENKSFTDSDMAENGNITAITKQKKRRINLKFLEVVSVGLVLFIVCGLYSIPTVIFALPVGKLYGGSGANASNSSSSEVCLEPAVYTGTTCRAELQMYQECFSGNATGPILIPSNINQEAREVDASNILSLGLQFLGASEECTAVIRPFFCLHLFTSCDASFEQHQVSAPDCASLRDGVCATEWMRATALLGDNILPICETLQSETDTCKTLAVQETEEKESLEELLASDVMPYRSGSGAKMNCSSQFYLSDSGECRPRCGRWLPRSVHREQIEIAVIICTAIMAVIAGIITLILGFCIQRDTVLIFPTIYLVYLGAAASIIAFTVLIGFTDKERLFCSSVDLLESLNSPTLFCTISGIVYNYGLLHMTFLILFHVLAIFWGVTQPFHYRKYKEYGYIKYIHISTVLMSVLVPLIPALANLKSGYMHGRIPPIVCTGINGEITFYTLILPICILFATASCMLIIIFWTILKEFFLKKLSKGKNISKVGQAQIKILLILVYYIIIGVVGMVAFTYNEVTSDTDVELRLRAEVLSNISLAVLAMLGLLPVFLFLILVDTAALKKKFSRKNSAKK